MSTLPKLYRSTFRLAAVLGGLWVVTGCRGEVVAMDHPFALRVQEAVCDFELYCGSQAVWGGGYCTWEELFRPPGGSGCAEECSLDVEGARECLAYLRKTDSCLETSEYLASCYGPIDCNPGFESCVDFAD